FFRWPLTVDRQSIPRKVVGYARRAFDQGVGRSLWFVRGANPRRIADTIERFPAARQANLWAGVGLAATFAGGCDEAVLRELVRFATPFASMLAQGAAFAAEARVRGSNPAEHTDLACQLISGQTSVDLAALCERTAGDLPLDGSEPAFEIWRERIQAALA
ncbi:MAG TPA: DUF1702 family protein, partial [Thermoanaerobaculia bacterium]|nr:DUF1702 family protein [Thermoanaerobaculia bacterium]